MKVNDIAAWYETSLSTRERKVRGHFSTPPFLVEQILDACGFTSDRDLYSQRILDPACGSGNFLVGAARRLIQAGKYAERSPQVIKSAIHSALWGLDPDPVACFLAETQLQMLLEQELGGAIARKHPQQRLHIHQADGLVFPWQEQQRQGYVDLFLANPPYLAAKNTDLSGYRVTEGRGQADSYLLFLELALRIVRPGGWLALVLPDAVLARTNAVHERRHLLARTTVHHLWHLAGVFPAHVGAVVIIAQNFPPPPMHAISWKRAKWTKTQHDFTQTKEHAEAQQQGHIAQQVLLQQPRSELRYLLSELRNTLVLRLTSAFHDTTVSTPAVENFVALGQLVTIRRGEELGKESELLCTSPPSDSSQWRPLLRGGVDVQAYTLPTIPACWIAYQALKKPIERYLAPKLLVVKSTAHLQAALDTQGHVVLQTLYMLTAHASTSEEDLYFLLALLNSRLLCTYVSILYTAYKWVQPQIEQHVLASLPIPCCTEEQKAMLVKRAKLLMRACSTYPSVVELQQQQVKDLYEEQERAIRVLYEAYLPR